MAKLSKCCVCDNQFNADYIVNFKRKKYCYDCFEQSYSQDVVEQHYFYLHFQETIGRSPSQLEWIQLKKMIEDSKSTNHKWDWWVLDRILTYTYEIEKKEISEEYGVVGIFPYMELRARQFFRIYDEAYEHNSQCGEIEYETVEIRSHNPKRRKAKPLYKANLDDIVNDEDLID